MDVNEHFHNPGTLTPGKDPLVFTEQEAVWASELVWVMWSRENSLASAES
jgi:hypothetical protein